MSEQAHFDILIVGGGHGGAQAATALRQCNYMGSIAIVTDEPELPYERPPLSKEYIQGDKTFDRILIRPAAFWQERSISMLLNRRVHSVDPVAHSVATADGATINYGQLIWATGGSPRRLVCKGSDLQGVHTLRTRADADRMIAELPDVTRAVVIGGGYIGLEVAAALTRVGKQVVLLEALDRVLARVAGEALSRFYEAQHRAQGVDLRLGVAIDCIEGSGKVSGVRLADGELVPADMVIVGIGIVPAVEPLITAGAAGGNGVAVDAHCRTSLPDIFAIGDCAAHENAFAEGRRIRLESVQNATDQATTVAKFIAGDRQPYRATPWFWSNQYDLRLQTVGLSSDHDDLVVRGDPATRSFSVVYLKSGRVVALDCVNATRDYVQGRKLVESGVVADQAALADSTISLKDCAPARP